MADYKLAITTTDAQDQALEWLRLTLNAEREADGRYKSWPDVTAMLSDLMTALIVAQYGQQYQDARCAIVTTALNRASLDEWAKVADVLGIHLP